MSKIDVVRAAMVEAMKAKDKQRKDALSMLLSALKNFEIDKKDHEPITEDEANTVVKKEIKQSQETFDTAPADRDDIREEAAYRLSVYKEFAPEDMSEEQIREVVTAVLAELEIEKPAPSDKGKIMKVLMPKVKGKADGKAVNEITRGFTAAGKDKTCTEKRLKSLSRHTDRRCLMTSVLCAALTVRKCRIKKACHTVRVHLLHWLRHFPWLRPMVSPSPITIITWEPQT